MKNTLIALYASLLITCFNFNATEAATIFVGPPPASIQAAVNSASNGDTVQLSAGTYIQEVQVINKSIDIVGLGQGVTIIQAPSAATHLTQFFSFAGSRYWCIVMVDNQAAPTVQTVNISDLTVDGSNQQDTVIPPLYGSANRFFAIGYHNAAGTVLDVHTTNTKQTAVFNQLAGSGIVNASDVGTVTFNVTNCLVDLYQRIGIDFRGAALTANVSGCTVNRGFTPTPNIFSSTPNGIEYSVSAKGSCTNNTSSLNISTIVNVVGCGILLFGNGDDLLVSGNTLTNNDQGLGATNSGNNLTIESNIANYTLAPGINTAQGIVVQDTDGLTTLTANTMDVNAGVNMTLNASTDLPFQLHENVFNNGQVGLLVIGNATVGPIVTMDSDVFTGTSGYYIQEDASPNDIWPSTATVSFDGLLSGHMTMAEFNFVLTKIFDQHNDPALGLVLDFIPPVPPTISSIDPTSGPEAGGTVVTITGFSFLSSDTEVFFGATPATSVTVISNTQIIATAPPGTGTVDITVVTSIGTTPIVPEDQFTYIPIIPLPPSNFVGVVVKNKFLNESGLFLKATWKASPTPNVVSYRIYKNGTLVQTVYRHSFLEFVRRLHSKSEAKAFSISAVNSEGVESEKINITIQDHS